MLFSYLQLIYGSFRAGVRGKGTRSLGSHRLQHTLASTKVLAYDYWAFESFVKESGNFVPLVQNGSDWRKEKETGCLKFQISSAVNLQCPQKRLPGPQWMPKTIESAELYIYYVFSYTCKPTLKPNL